MARVLLPLLLSLGAGCSSARGEAPQPALKIPQRLGDAAYTLRARELGRGPAFAASVTRRFWAELPENSRKCSNQLLAAQVRAAASNALRATRTFRNCAIPESHEYLQNQVRRFMREGKLNDLGSALAALHAFYTYTNYIEREHKGGTSLAALIAAPPRIWSDRVDPDLLENLISDTSAQVSPVRCNTPIEIDKSTDGEYGAKLLEGGDWDVPVHEAAIQVAMSDTDQLLKQAFKTQKEFTNTCGATLVFGFTFPWR